MQSVVCQYVLFGDHAAQPGFYVNTICVPVCDFGDHEAQHGSMWIPYMCPVCVFGDLAAQHGSMWIPYVCPVCGFLETMQHNSVLCEYHTISMTVRKMATKIKAYQFFLLK